METQPWTLSSPASTTSSPKSLEEARGVLIGSPSYEAVTPPPKLLTDAYLQPTPKQENSSSPPEPKKEDVADKGHGQVPEAKPSGTVELEAKQPPVPENICKPKPDEILQEQPGKENLGPTQPEPVEDQAKPMQEENPETQSKPMEEEIPPTQPSPLPKDARHN